MTSLRKQSSCEQRGRHRTAAVSVWATKWFRFEHRQLAGDNPSRQSGKFAVGSFQDGPARTWTFIALKRLRYVREISRALSASITSCLVGSFSNTLLPIWDLSLPQALAVDFKSATLSARVIPTSFIFW